MKKGMDMKKAFTMIELVFVIVILGILAAIAIPKLVASKDDAMAVKATTEMATVITQLSAWYFTHGNFKPVIHGCPDPGVTPDSMFLQNIYVFTPNGQIGGCLKDFAPSYLEYYKAPKPINWNYCVMMSISNDGKITVKPFVSNISTFCKTIYNTPAFLQWSKYGIDLGGSSIYGVSSVSH